MCTFPDCSEDIKESQNIASLHKQIAACDQILEVIPFNTVFLPVCSSFVSVCYCKLLIVKLLLTAIAN